MFLKTVIFILCHSVAVDLLFWLQSHFQNRQNSVQFLPPSLLLICFDKCHFSCGWRYFCLVVLVSFVQLSILLSSVMS